MTKNVLITALVAVLATVVTVKVMAPTGGQDVTGETKQESTYERVMRTGKLRCSYIVWPPEFDKDPNTGEFSGISYDLTNEMAKRMGIEIDWVEEVNFGNMAEGLKTDRYDAICFTLYRDNTRALVSEMATPLFYSGTGIYVRADDSRFDGQDFSILDSEKLSVSTIDGEMSAIVAKERFPKTQTISLPQSSNVADVLLNVVTNKADFTIVNNLVAENFMKNNPGKIKNLDKNQPILLFAHSFSFPKGAHSMVSATNIVLEEMLDHGVVDQILDQHPSDAKTYYRVAKPYKE